MLGRGERYKIAEWVVCHSRERSRRTIEMSKQMSEMVNKSRGRVSESMDRICRSDEVIWRMFAARRGEFPCDLPDEDRDGQRN